MRETMAGVRSFHEKHGFAVSRPLAEEERRATQSLHNLGEVVRQVGAHIIKLAEVEQPDLRLERVHLMTEELGEVYDALERCDEVELLDALADLLYVVAGTAVAYGLPLLEAVVEVQVSNMTKDDVEGRFGHPKKGPGFRPPRLKSVLQYYREPAACRIGGGPCKIEPCPLTCAGRGVGAEDCGGHA